jgi:predicted acyl esterase
MSNSNKNGGQHGVQVTAGRVAMRDGVELNVRITRPDTPGKFPTILEYNPYRRLNAPPAGSRDGYPLVVPYLAERGYVVVQYDVRGTGSSAGFAPTCTRKTSVETVMRWSSGAPPNPGAQARSA